MMFNTRRMRAAAALISMPFMQGSSNGIDVFSRSFFTVRPHFNDDLPEKLTMFRSRRIDAKYDGIGGAFEVVGYYSQSMNAEGLGRYFLPFGKSHLNVVEFKVPVTDNSNPALEPNSDIDMPFKNLEARHFNIQTNDPTRYFQSTISLCPSQKVGGIGFNYKQTFWRDCNDLPKMWIEIAFPIEHVENKVVLREFVQDYAGGPIKLPNGTTQLGLDGAPRVGTMTEAFKQCNWKYGKIDSRPHSKWGVADLDVRLTYATHWGAICHLDGFIGFLAPTGNKVDQEAAAFVFSPIVGFNHHWAFSFGNYFHVDAWSCGEHELRIAYNTISRIFAPNKQWRSFDLFDKQFSRYAEVYTSLAMAEEAAASVDPNVINTGVSGINVFTRCVEVRPKYDFSTNAAMIYHHCHWTAEIGYNFYVRHAEEIRLCCWDDNIVLKAVDGGGLISQARDMRHNYRQANLSAPTDYSKVVITADQLDLESAAHPEILSNIIYVSAGYDWDVRGYPMFAGWGGSYEFSSANVALNRWTVWGKIGMSF